MTKENKSSRTAYAFKNILFNFGYQIVNTIVNIILPPLLIGYFGSAINGLISTIKQIITYIQLVGAGISDSTVVSLYKPLGEKNNKAVSAIYNAVNKAFNRAGFLFSAIALLVAFVYPLFLREDISYFLVVEVILVLAISGCSEFFALGKYRSLLIADQKLYIVNLAQIFGAVTSTALTILLIRLNVGIVLVQLAASLAYIFRIFILYLYVRKNYRYIDKTVEPDLSAVSKRKAATIHQVAALIIFGSQTLIIANICGLVEASVYAVYNLVFTGINTILATVSSGMLGGMGNLMATEGNEKVRKVFNIYELSYNILTFTVYITALIMIRPFISIYTRVATDAQYVRPELIVLFTIMGLLNCLRTPGATVINAKGHYKETQNRALLEMSICLVGELVFVWQFGIAGVLIGTVLAYLYRTIDVILYSNHHILMQSPKRSLLRVLRYICVLAVGGFAAFGINIPADGYVMWALYAIGVTAAAGVAVLVVTLLFDRATMSEAYVYARDILRRKRHAE